MARLLRRLLLGVALALSQGCVADTIVVFGNDYSEPKIYLKDGQPHGILVDILHYAEQKLPGTHFELVLYPWSRAYSAAESGQGGIIGLSRTTQRLATFDYSDPVFVDEVVMVVRKERVFAYRKIDDLRGMRIGIGRSGSFGEEFEDARTRGVFEIDPDDGPVSRLRKLLVGRIDVALINPGRAGLVAALRKDPEMERRVGELAVLPVALKQDTNHLAFAKRLNRRDFLEDFNAVIRKGQASGELPRLIEPYLNP